MSRGIIAASLGAIIAYAALVPGSGATVACSRVAATTGSDGDPGTEAQPFRTAQRLADSLAAGQTGCLRGGTYRESLKIDHGGTAQAPLTLRSYPGERARLVGRIWIALGSDYVTVSHLYLDGTNTDGGPEAPNLPSPTVNANHVTFQYDEITNNHTGICLILGSDWGPAHYAVVDRNRIHDCGRLPATNHDHGIYASWTTGAQITNNLIYDNADRGVQLYPDVQQATIRNNIIDGNGQGVIFSGADGIASNNVVKNNVITNSKIRWNVESYYSLGNPIGWRNRVRRNCIAGGVRDHGDGSIMSPHIGFSVSSNYLHSPRYVNRATKDFRLRAGPCRSMVGDVAAMKSFRHVP